MTTYLLLSATGVGLILVMASAPWRLAYAILALVLLVPPTVSLLPKIAHSNFGSIAYILMGFSAAGIALLVLGPSRNMVSLRPLLALVAALPSLLLNGSRPLVSTTGVVPYITTMLLVAFLASLFRSYPKAHKQLLELISYTAIPIAAIALLQLTTGAPNWYAIHASTYEYEKVVIGGRVASTLGHPNLLGLLMAVCILLAIELRPPGTPLILLAGLAGILASGSRSALVAVCIGAIYWYSIGKRTSIPRRQSNRTPWRRIAAAVGALGAVAGGWTILSRALTSVISNRLGALGSDTSSSAHALRWSEAWHLITNNVLTIAFGHGPNYSLNYLNNAVSLGDTQAQTFDNTYLTYWVDYGVIGLALLGIALWFVLRRRPLGVPAVLGILTAMFAFDVQMWPIALVLLAILLAAPSQERETSAQLTNPAQEPVKAHNVNLTAQRHIEQRGPERVSITCKH